MGKTSELLSLLKTGNSDAARRLIIRFKKAGKKKALTKELNVPDDNGQTVIHFCAAQNFVEFLQDLAELGASVDLADNKGYTPLHLAAMSGRTSAVTALVGMGADPNISSRTGDTALHLACHGGHVTSVEALVLENANCTMLNVSGHTPLDLACQSGHAQVVSLLLRSGQFSASYLQRSDMPHTALMLAAKQGHNECIGLLVKHGFDVNRKLPGGNGGTALHEAALYGKVDTVRYLLQCGVSVQQTNAQGLTALDVVNMYTDPRTASIMKQVLQDALAQLARTRIAEQHAGQQHAGQQVRGQQVRGQQHAGQQHAGQQVRGQQHAGQQHAGQQHAGQQHAGQQHAGQQVRGQQHAGQQLRGQQVRGQQHAGQQPRGQQHAGKHYGGQHPPPTVAQTSPSAHLQPAGFSYFSPPGQPLHQVPSHAREPSGHAYRQPGHPQPSAGDSHQPFGQSHQPIGQSQPMGSSMHHSRQSAGHSQHPTGHSHQSAGHSQQSTVHSRQFAGHSQQPTDNFHQNAGQSRQPSSQSHTHVGHSHQSAGQSHQPTDHFHQNAGQSRQPASQSYTHVGQSNPPVGQQQHKGHSYHGQQQQPVAHSELHRQSGDVQASPPSSASHVQHIYPKPGTPESVRKAPPGIGGDLAAIIAAKAASRKPIVTSPTRKEFSEAEDDRFTRSMTVGGESAMQQARTSALQRRRSSMSDRSSASPERSEVINPPTLPRRVQAGPPSFKPVPPPPSDDPRMVHQGSDVRDVHVSEQSPPPRHASRQKIPKVQPAAAPATSADDELMAKLLRRQNKMSEAEQVAPEQPSPAPEDNEEVDEEDPIALQSKPPPPPQRKTPSLTPADPYPSPPVAPPPASIPPPEPASTEASGIVKQLKSKPPTPKHKEVEPEMSPWQLELAARKARLAEHESGTDAQLVSNKDDGVQDREPSPTSLPKQQPAPVPKPKRKPPPPATRLVASHELPPPVPPPPEQPPSPTTGPPDQLPPPPPTSIPPREQSTYIPPQEQVPPVPRVVMEEPESPALPAEVATLAAGSTDHLSRSTSMSSLTTGTGSPQMSHMEHMPISEWLVGYKLADYAPVLEGHGYETTELLVGISHEELQEMGINKIGHRKKLLSALSNWPQQESFFHVKPESVAVWLSVLHLSQYEQTLLDAGYDDIDFICDVTLDDLHDIGISKIGHVKRLLRGIGEMTELMKSGLPFSSPVSVPMSQNLESLLALPPPSPPPTEPSNYTPASAVAEPILPPPQSWTDVTSSEPERVDFALMKRQLEMNMGVNSVPEDHSEKHTIGSSSLPSTSHTVPPLVPRQRDRQPEWAGSLQESSQLPPQLPPKRNRKSPSWEVSSREASRGRDELDSGAGNSFSVEDITAALGETELDKLDAVLQGFTDENDSPRAQETEPDQLLADIDDMLADLTTHLDVMIPGST